jgi:hypothetical protein
LSDIKGKTKKAFVDLAQDSFEKIKNEPAEVGKAVVEQMTGATPERSAQEISQRPEKETQMQAKDEQQSKRLLQANRAEIQDIRKNRKINEALQKIQKGEDVNPSLIEGISQEQKDYLRSQKEIVSKSIAKQQEGQMRGGLVEPTTKQRRGVFGAFKQKVSQMRTAIETRFKSVG